MDGGGAPRRLSDEGHRLYRIRQTCMKMLEKRGFNVLQEHLTMTSDRFMQDFGPDPKREDMTLLVEKVSGRLTERHHSLLRLLFPRRGAERKLKLVT